MNNSYHPHKIPENKTSKNGIKDVQISDIFTTCHFYASWSGFDGHAAAPDAFVIVDWQQFHKFLLQRMIAKTAGDRLRYAKQFHSVLSNGQAAPLLELQPNKRIHAMKALASLARFTGSYDKWMQIRQRYNLKWSTGNETLITFQRFFDDSKSMNTMIQWVKQAISVLPADMAQVIKFDCFIGLRPIEAINAIELIKNPDTFKTYYNASNGMLEHFRFPNISKTY